MPAQKITKRPITVDAFRWDGGAEQAGEIIAWVLKNGGTARYHDAECRAESGNPHPTGEHIVVDTLEGAMVGRPGWWFIRGVQGEFYPCHPHVLAATYDVEG